MVTLQKEIDKAFNQGMKKAARIASLHQFETRDKEGKVHTYQVGKKIAEIILSKLRKAKR